MASTYSSLKIQLMGTGENSGTWGNVTNTNLGTALEEAIVGSADVSFAGIDITLTLTDSNASQTARNLRLNLTGTSSGARNLIVPAIEKVYIVNNGCADSVTVKNSTGTGIAVPAGKTMWVYNNGTNVVDVTTHLSSLTLASALPITSGGTGTNATTYCNVQANVTGILPTANGGTGTTSTTGTGSAVFSASPTFTGTPAAPTAANSTNTTQLATTSFVQNVVAGVVAGAIPAGVICMWSGAIASIPSGWSICDGSNGTPDLRNRFIVAAGSTYSVGGTGGSADSIVVDHTHSASSSSTFTGSALGTHNHTATSVVTDPMHTHQVYCGTTSGPQSIPPSDGDGNVPQFAQTTTSSATGITVATTNTASPAGTPSGSVSTSTSIGNTGSSGSGANLPPYYALAYIMKL